MSSDLSLRPRPGETPSDVVSRVTAAAFEQTKSDLFAELLNSAADYMEARTERDRQAEACETDWQFYGQRAEEDMERAAKRCRKAFDRYLTVAAVSS